MTFDQDFCNFILLFSSLFFSEGREQWKRITKVVVKSHAFLLDLSNLTCVEIFLLGLRCCSSFLEIMPSSHLLLFQNLILDFCLNWNSILTLIVLHKPVQYCNCYKKNNIYIFFIQPDLFYGRWG